MTTFYRNPVRWRTSIDSSVSTCLSRCCVSYAWPSHSSSTTAMAAGLVTQKTFGTGKDCLSVLVRRRFACTRSLEVAHSTNDTINFIWHAQWWEKRGFHSDFSLHAQYLATFAPPLSLMHLLMMLRSSPRAQSHPNHTLKH